MRTGISYTIFTTLDPSAIPASVFTSTFPSFFLASSSSHHPNKKSRAMSLNQGVNVLAKCMRQVTPVRDNSCKWQAGNLRTWIVKHSNELLFGNILMIAYFVQIRCHIHISRHEKNIVDCKSHKRNEAQISRGLISNLPSCSPHNPLLGAR
jgi:hypothetical protein